MKTDTKSYSGHMFVQGIMGVQNDWVEIDYQHSTLMVCSIMQKVSVIGERDNF